MPDVRNNISKVNSKLIISATIAPFMYIIIMNAYTISNMHYSTKL